jgi:hypothetical protein
MFYGLIREQFYAIFQLSHGSFPSLLIWDGGCLGVRVSATKHHARARRLPWASECGNNFMEPGI